MITLFIKNGMTNAAKYVEYCQRNGVTQDDINLMSYLWSIWILKWSKSSRKYNQSII